MTEVVHRPWREVVNDLVQTHHEHGSAISMVHPVPEAAIESHMVVNTCGDCLALDGDLKPKPVRQWLWTHRKARAFHRPGALIWSHSWGDGTLVGYGSLASQEAAERLQAMRRWAGIQPLS